MLYFDTPDIKFIKDNFENSEYLLNTDDVNEVLDAISIFMLKYGFGNSYCLTEIGRIAEKVYHNVYNNN